MSFPRYPEYKDSGVEWLGDVPVHWEVEDLKYRCEIIPSNVDKKSHSDELPVQLCNYTDVYYNTRITSDLTFMRATARKDEIDKFQLESDDVVITKDSETADDIAVPAIVADELPGVLCGYHLAIIRASGFSSGPFVNYLFQSHSLRYYFEITARGLTRVGLSESAIGNSEIAWPELNEQRRIAAFLDYETARIDALVAEQQRLIELLKEKRQVVISHAITKGLDPDVPMKDSGVEWLGEVPAHWGVERFKLSVESCRNGIWGEEPAGDGNDLPCVRVADFDRTRLRVVLEEPTLRNIKPNEKKGRLLTRGNLVLEKSGGGEKQPVGFVVLYDDERDAVCSNFTAKIELSDGMNPSYWRYVHAAAYLIRLNVPSIKQTSGIQNLDQQSYLDERAAYPPKDEQAKIAAYLDHETARIDALVKEGESVINLLKERRSALISAAVTGKIDVRDWKASADAAPEPYDMAAESGALYEVNRS